MRLAENGLRFVARLVRRATLIGSLTTDPPPATDPGLASRALALDAALTTADAAALPLRPTETALLRDWLHQLAR